jgi:hypothetical protein
MTVTSAQHVDCYEARVGKGDDRGEDHSDWPIGVLATVCRVTAILCVPLVRSRRRQFLKATKPMLDAKGGGASHLLFICKIWYSISQTVSDLGNTYDRSIRAFRRQAPQLRLAGGYQRD